MKNKDFEKLDILFYLVEWKDNVCGDLNLLKIPDFYFDFENKIIKEIDDEFPSSNGKHVMFDVVSCENYLNYLIIEVDGYFEFLSKVFNPLLKKDIIKFEQFAVQDNKNELIRFSMPVENNINQYEVVDLTNPYFSKCQSFIFEIETIGSKDYFGEYDVEYSIKLESYLNQKYEKIHYGENICPIIEY